MLKLVAQARLKILWIGKSVSVRVRLGVRVKNKYADMVELADTPDLESDVEKKHEVSSTSIRTKNKY